MTTFSENFVLSKEHAVDTTHQATSLTVEVRVDFLLESGLVEVAGTNCNTEGDGLLFSLSGHILEDSDGRVNASTLSEERSHSSSGTLGSNEDDIDVLRNVDLGLLFEDRGETVGEV